MATIAPISYFKRYKMEVVLDDLSPPLLPGGYSWLPWSEALLEAHAEVLYRSFHQEIDAHVFASLGSRDGCTNLMTAIARRRGFVPEATWLLTGREGLCGTVQGLRERCGLGAIQNLGIVPGARGRGLGQALLLQALHGFRRAGLGRALRAIEHHPRQG